MNKIIIFILIPLAKWFNNTELQRKWYNLAQQSEYPRTKVWYDKWVDIRTDLRYYKKGSGNGWF